MALICESYYFYPNGIYKTDSHFDCNTHTYFSDIEEVSSAIRVFGTKEQIEKALDDYMKRTDLSLDECYNFKVEPKGSYWYNIYGSKADKINKETAKKLEQYLELYLKRNNHSRKFKALIINLK
jgi:hypothetical protein|tara:strand:- start:154 stop:525 length:372 start_codon:yes stop_codon:yes gene_type:complete